MKPRPTTLEDLIDSDRISPSLIDGALSRGCPQAVVWCDRLENGLSRKQLREQIVQNLPPAMRVGLTEVIRGRYGSFQCEDQPQRLIFTWSAHLDLLSRGRLAHTITVRCVARMTRSAGKVRLDSQNHLQIDAPDMPWLCTTELSLAEADLVANAAMFHRQEREVTLRDVEL